MFTVKQEAGSGRAQVVLYDSARYAAFAEHVYFQLAQSAHAVLLESAAVTADNWRECAESLVRLLRDERQLRQLSFIAFGEAAALAQHLTLQHPKLVRSLVLVDAHTRPHPTLRQRLLAWLEARLPLGLPFSRCEESFDVKPYLQRLRCPTLVVTTNGRRYELEEAGILERRLPAAWRVNCADPEALSLEIARFQDVPAKRPQKNVRTAGGLSGAADVER